MAQSLARVNVHVKFSTKHRARALPETIRVDLHAFMAGVLRQRGCEPVLINSVEDHVHALFDLGRTVSVSDAVRAMKMSSSAWLKARGRECADFEWQGGYGAFSVDCHTVSSVRRYIENQAVHHRTESFQDELRRLLTENGLTFDERFIWD